MASSRLAALCLAVSTCSALGEQVEVLTKANFQKRIEESDIMLVKFYAPWCGHCKQMAPAYEEAAQKLAKMPNPIVLANVDSTQEPEISQAQGVRGYPTLKIYRRGVASDYDGPRDADGIFAHMVQQAGGSHSAATRGSISNPLSEGGEAAPLLLARLCRDQTCTDEKFPILDYDEVNNKCICSAHPCWDDDGKVHACAGTDFPHLKFDYNKEGKLNCGCSSTAEYQSMYISKVKCAGEHCDSPEHPLLDFDPKANGCLCKAHPCHDVDGVKHACDDPKFPILVYREETADGKLKKVCECKTISKKSEEEL